MASNLFIATIENTCQEQALSQKQELTARIQSISQLIAKTSELEFTQKDHLQEALYKEILNANKAACENKKIVQDFEIIIENNDSLSPLQKAEDLLVLYQTSNHNAKLIEEKLTTLTDTIFRLHKKHLKAIAEHNLYFKILQQNLENLLTPLCFPLLPIEDASALSSKIVEFQSLVDDTKAIETQLKAKLRANESKKIRQASLSIELFKASNSHTPLTTIETLAALNEIYQKHNSLLTPLLTSQSHLRKVWENKLSELIATNKKLDATTQRLKQTIQKLQEEGSAYEKLPAFAHFIKKLENKEETLNTLRQDHRESFRLELKKNILIDAALSKTLEKKEALFNQLLALEQELSFLATDQTKDIGDLSNQRNEITTSLLNNIEPIYKEFIEELASFNQRLHNAKSLTFIEKEDKSFNEYLQPLERVRQTIEKLITRLKNYKIPSHHLMLEDSDFRKRIKKVVPRLNEKRTLIAETLNPLLSEKSNKTIEGHNKAIEKLLLMIKSIENIQAKNHELFTTKRLYIPKGSYKLYQFNQLQTVCLDTSKACNLLLSPSVQKTLEEQQILDSTKAQHSLTSLKEKQKKLHTFLLELNQNSQLALKATQKTIESDEFKLLATLIDRLKKELIRYPIKSFDGDPRRALLLCIIEALQSVLNAYKLLQYPDKKAFIESAIGAIDKSLINAPLESLSSFEQSDFLLFIRETLLRPLTHLLNKISEKTGLFNKFEVTFFASDSESGIKAAAYRTSDSLRFMI